MSTIDGRLRVPANIDSLQKFREWVHADDFPEKLHVSYIVGDVEVELSPENAEFHGKTKVSVRNDTRSLREKYFKAGIPEYWLIDTRGFSIDFQVLVRGASGYDLVTPDAEGYCLSQVFQTSFLLTRRRNPLGAFTYKLMQR